MSSQSWTIDFINEVLPDPAHVSLCMSLQDGRRTSSTSDQYLELAELPSVLCEGSSTRHSYRGHDELWCAVLHGRRRIVEWFVIVTRLNSLTAIPILSELIIRLR